MNRRVFAARGVLAIAFAVCVFVTLAIAPLNAICVFAVFSVIDGGLALFAGHSVRRSWTNLRRGALFGEGFVEIAVGLFVMFGGQSVPIIACAIAANAIIGGASASVYSFGDKDERSENWWALYGFTGVILGFAVAALIVAGISAILIAVGIVAVIQGVARLFLSPATLEEVDVHGYS
jgi:uncharacterized membrane protein HdeD (DUF308 family)